MIAGGGGDEGTLAGFASTQEVGRLRRSRLFLAMSVRRYGGGCGCSGGGMEGI